MFNRSRFNTSFYDRSTVTKISIAISIQAVSEMVLNLHPLYNLTGSFGGSGALSPDLIAVTEIHPQTITGSGGFEVTYLVFFFLPLEISISGGSRFQMTMGIQIPLESVEFEGSGDAISISGVLQNMAVDLRSSGTMSATINLLTPITNINFSGGNYWVSPEFRLLLPMPTSLFGTGSLRLRRIGELDSITFELEGIYFSPGQTLVIDTDLLTVFINNLLDVSAVTSESTFFELSPGDTTIRIENSPGESIQGNIVWQNRWL